MNKTFKLYLVVWVWLVALFNVVSLVVPATPINDKFTNSFWIGYIFILLMLICQLVCAAIALKDKNAKKVFYNIPIIRTSYLGLIFSFIAGSMCMIFSAMPYWVGVVICACIFVLNAFSMAKAEVAVNEVERIDEKVKTQTFFIKSLTIDAESLTARAKDDVITAECKKVAEALRYSDPMSNDALASVEGAITIKFAELSNAVQANDKEKAISYVRDLLILIDDRNKKCKLLK